MGIGREATPRSFVNACDVFVYTENLQKDVDGNSELPIRINEAQTSYTESDDTASQSSRNRIGYEELFRRAVDITLLDDGWVHLGTLGSSLRQLDPAFDPRTYRSRSLSKLVRSNTDFFELKEVPTSNGNIDLYVRLRE